LTAVSAALLLAGCSPLPGPSPRPPAELIFVPGADRGHAVFEAADGTQVATLAAGGFSAELTSGGDLGEAYLAAEDGVLYRVRAGRPFRVDREGELPGRPPYQAALVHADMLTTYVGMRTVLVVLSADGALAGYQAGNRLWLTRAASGASLRRVGNAAVLGVEREWSLVAGETGRTIPLVSDCLAGPLAVVAGALVTGCPGATPPGASLPLPPGPAFALAAARRDSAVLVYPSGEWYRIGKGPAKGPVVIARGTGPATPGSPALAPDGGTIYWPSQVGAHTLAISRDGTYLYALDAGGLRVLTSAGHSQVASYPGVKGSAIELITGG
jgi:hypothetical protein